MILDNMTLEEVGMSLLRTARENKERFNRLVIHRQKKYRRIVLKRKDKKADFAPIHSEAEKVDFYICPFYFDKRRGMFTNLIASFKYKKKQYYCLFCKFDTIACIVTTHFLERFAERHLKDDNPVGISTLRLYLRAIHFTWNPEIVKHPYYDNRFVAGTHIGVCCGYKISDNIYILKTFIDQETIDFGDKKRIFDESAGVLSKIELDCHGREKLPTELLELAESACEFA